MRTDGRKDFTCSSIQVRRPSHNGTASGILLWPTNDELVIVYEKPSQALLRRSQERETLGRET